MLIACECVARTGSVCVVGDDGAERAFHDLDGHEAERRLVTALDELVRVHGRPDALAVAAGPGSFTGLRIATVAVRTLAWLEHCPVHAVDSLAARAAQEGDGLWWVLLPLKRDTTFHGLFRVQGGVVTTLWPTTAWLDDAALPAGDRPAEAVAIGPALSAKPDLAARWWPGIVCGSAAPLTARGVARLAPQIPAISWDHLLPAYHQLSAPELQRLARRSEAGDGDRVKQG